MRSFRFKAYVVFLTLIFVLQSAGHAQTGGANESLAIGNAMLKEMLRHKTVPFEDSALSGMYPRVSIVGGALEKILNLFWEQNGTHLGFMLTESAQPSGLPENPYVNLTKSGGNESFEARLAARIAASHGDLMPDQVLGMALDVCGEDYWTAVLTAHNLLKEVAYAERKFFRGVDPVSDKVRRWWTGDAAPEGTTGTAVVGWDAAAPDSINEWRLSRFGEVSEKLRNLRPENDPHKEDLIGPWYHIFGLFFIGGMASGPEAELLAFTENLTRHLRLGSKRDSFKEDMNTWAAALSYSLNAMVDQGIYVPANLDDMPQHELAAIYEMLRKKHRELQSDLPRWQKLVNQELEVVPVAPQLYLLPREYTTIDLGRYAVWQMDLIRDQQSAIFHEALRVRAAMESPGVVDLPPLPPPTPAAEPASDIAVQPDRSLEPSVPDQPVPGPPVAIKEPRAPERWAVVRAAYKRFDKDRHGYLVMSESELDRPLTLAGLTGRNFWLGTEKTPVPFSRVSPLFGSSVEAADWMAAKCTHFWQYRVGANFWMAKHGGQTVDVDILIAQGGRRAGKVADGPPPKDDPADETPPAEETDHQESPGEIAKEIVPGQDPSPVSEHQADPTAGHDDPITALLSGPAWEDERVVAIIREANAAEARLQGLDSVDEWARPTGPGLIAPPGVRPSYGGGFESGWHWQYDRRSWMRTYVERRLRGQEVTDDWMRGVLGLVARTEIQDQEPTGTATETTPQQAPETDVTGTDTSPGGQPAPPPTTSDPQMQNLAQRIAALEKMWYALHDDLIRKFESGDIDADGAEKRIFELLE